MQDPKHKIKSTSRRSILRAGVLAGSLATLPNVSVARSGNRPSLDELLVTSRHLVDAKITHPGVDELPEISLDGSFLSTYAEGGRLFLITVPPAKIKANAGPLLRTPNDLTFLKTFPRFDQLTLFKETPVDGRLGTRLITETSYDPFQFTVEVDENSLVVADGEETVATVPIGAERRITLEPKIVETAEYGPEQEVELERPGLNGTKMIRTRIGTKELKLKPVLTVKNHGTVNVYGAQNGPVVPQTAEFPVRGLVEGARASGNIELQPTTSGEAAMIDHRFSYRGTYNQDRGCAG